MQILPTVSRKLTKSLHGFFADMTIVALEHLEDLGNGIKTDYENSYRA